jgi:arylsulfatase A-like enzyme
MNRQPNILLILTDQHRLSALGCYGRTPCRTPNLDRLAAEGVRFENAYTTCPVCSPARASIITGQYPHRHGVLTNCGASGPVWNIPDHSRMLPRQLQTAGYRCGYSGKWHLCPEPNCVEWFNQPIPHHLPRDLGFDGQNFPGHGGGGFGYQEYKDYLGDNGLEFRLVPGSDNPRENLWPSYGIQDGPKEATVDHFLTNNTITLMNRFRAAHEPFFIWQNFWGPHEPYYPVEEFFAPYRALETEPWPNFRVPAGLIGPQHRILIHPRAAELGWDYWNRALRHYYAFTTQIDDQVGRIYAHLETSGLLDDTIIIFSSDHGETLGDHGGMTNKGNSHFEEIQRIGMIIRYPEKFRPQGCQAGSARRELVSLADIHPTCLDLAGLAAPAETHGISVHALLAGRAAPHEAVFTEFYGLYAPTAMFTCRCGNWKYGYNPNNTDELYNLADDPHELHNRIADPGTRAVRRDMLDRLARHLPGGTRNDAERRMKEV